MTIARALGWLLLIGAIALARGGVPGGEPAVRTFGPYAVLQGDFHIHSFPGDGGLLPWDLAGEARRRGLDVIALTNHNSMWSWRLAQWLDAPMYGVIVLPGVELTSAGYHMAAIGIATPVPWRQPPAAAVAAVQAQGGLAIAAHPRSPSPSKWEDAAIDALDGFEAASSNDLLRDNAASSRRFVTRQPTIASIGSSDFHYFAPLGVSRTFVFVTERSAAGVRDAIRNGRTVACDGLGATYGPAELASAVTGECQRIAGSNPIGWRQRDSVATALAWVALVALVGLGARERV